MTRGPTLNQLAQIMYPDQAFTLKCRMKLSNKVSEDMRVLSLASEYTSFPVDSLPDYPEIQYLKRISDSFPTLLYDGNRFRMMSVSDWRNGIDLMRLV